MTREYDRIYQRLCRQNFVEIMYKEGGHSSDEFDIGLLDGKPAIATVTSTGKITKVKVGDEVTEWSKWKDVPIHVEMIVDEELGKQVDLVLAEHDRQWRESLERRWDDC